MKVDKKLVQEHMDKMQKLFDEQVKNEKDEEKADANCERLAKEEAAWLKEHPGYPRFFSPLNDEVNPMVLNFPDMKKVPCKGCAFVSKKPGGEINAFCKVYQYPNMKPDNVLWGDKPSCEYRIDEKEAKKAKKEA